MEYFGDLIVLFATGFLIFLLIFLDYVKPGRTHQKNRNESDDAYTLSFRESGFRQPSVSQAQQPTNTLPHFTYWKEPMQSIRLHRR